MKTDTDELVLFVEKYKKIEAAARALLIIQAQKKLSHREYDRVRLEDFHLSAIDDYGITLTAEYNDSCGCHPEYQTAYVSIGWDDIERRLCDPVAQ